MLFDGLHKSMARRLRRFSLTPIRFRKRHQLQLVMALMSLNILISLSILNQQSKLTTIFDSYISNFRYKHDNNKLLKLLDSYRSVFNSNYQQPLNKSNTVVVVDQSQPRKARPFNLRHRLAISITEKVSDSVEIQPGEDQKIRDYYFNAEIDNKKSVRTSGGASSKHDVVDFYSPRVLIDNPSACEANVVDSSRKQTGNARPRLFMIALIHSHVNNYLRRKTMRETWLSIRSLRLAHLYPHVLDSSQDYELHFAHMFVLGVDRRRRDHVLDSVRNESLAHNDILLIDLEEDYKNLVYKHLALVDWVSQHCQNVSYVLKMDDDVLVNIKSLARHLIERISPAIATTTTSSSRPHQDKFLYCNINQKSLPVRRNSSKWFVHPDTYPFEWYPKYCEGFAYITNLNTIRFMSEQSRRIPRFWIDDVYFTGLLFHGIDDVKWIDYKVGNVEWSYYDFWDLGNTLSIYELYAYILKLFNINAVDYYKSNHFVILHTQLGSEEVNYTVSDAQSRMNQHSRAFSSSPSSSSSSSSWQQSARDKMEFCQNSVLKYVASSPSEFVDSPIFKSLRSSTSSKRSSSSSSSSSSSNLDDHNTPYTYLDCLDLVDDRKFILDVYFYEFCLNLWENSFV